MDKIAHLSVTVKNADAQSFTITRITANGNDADASCNEYPNKTVAPGDSYITTFIVCGAVHGFRVETDRGAASFGS